MDQEQEGKVSEQQQKWKAPKFKQSLKINPKLQVEIKQQEERQEAADQLRADEVRRSIGLPTVEAAQPPKPKSRRDLFVEQIEEATQAPDSAQRIALARQVISTRLAELKDHQMAVETIQPVFGTMKGEKFKYDGFIGETTKIKRGASAEFQLDDETAYLDFADTLQEVRAQIGDKSIGDYLPYAVFRHIGKYFGNYVSNNQTESSNQAFYAEQADKIDLGEAAKTSISDMKGMGIAVCAEKAALAQNLFQIAGMESKLVSGGVSGGQEQSGLGHYYNIISSENGSYLVDVTNPVVYSREGQMVNFNPSIYPLTQDQMASLEGIKPIEVTHTDYEIGDDNSLTPRETKLTYS